MGTEGVIVLDQGAETKRVRLGTRSQSSKIKKHEYEDTTSQQAGFQKTAIKMEVNSKETSPKSKLDSQTVESIESV